MSPGDVFLVPLPDGSVVAGRLTPEFGRATFYRKRFPEGSRIPGLADFETFELKAHITLDPIREGRWAIVGHEPWRDGSFQFQRYLIPPHVACAVGPTNVFTDVAAKLEPPVGDTWKGLPKFSIWNEPGVVEMLDAAVPHGKAEKP